MVLDVRYEKEAAPFIEKYGKERWGSIPYEQVRERCKELSVDTTYIVFCNAGSRSYEVQVILSQAGLKNLVVPGGFNVLRRIGGDWLPL
jgi:rhodanese-related sulfurtransferase